MTHKLVQRNIPLSLSYIPITDYVLITNYTPIALTKPIRNYKTRMGLVRSYNSKQSKARCVSIRKWHYKIYTEEEFVKCHGLHKKEIDPRTGMFFSDALRRGSILHDCFCKVCKKIYGGGRIGVRYK